MATHAVFTIVADVKAGAERQLEKDLQAFDVAEKFKGVPSLHFASFVVFDPDCLHLPLSKLVLECAIDGPIAPFLRDLAQRCDLSPAFTHCEGYDQATDALAFLQSHVRKPQLYHVGTPYQSAASILSDIKERDELNHRLRKAGVLSLDGLLDSAPAGMREFWRLEILQPWLALPTAVAGLWLAWLIWRNTSWHEWQSVPSFLDTLVAVAVAFFALRSAFVMWQSALPDLRRRVVSWLAWFAKGVVLGALTLVAVRVWPRHAVPIVSWVSTLFGAATLYRIYTDVSSQRDARLSETRGNTSIDAAWRALKNTPVDTSEPRAYRSWTWRGVLDVLTAAALFVLIWFALYYAQSNGISTAIVVAWATGVMFLRAAWLTVRGFRANGLWLEARHGIAAFLGFAAFVGIVVGFTLTRTPAFVGGAIGLVFVFALGPLWNWRWWIAGYPLAYLSLSAAIESGHTVEVHLAVTTLFFLKAWWLTVLIGWPGEKPAPLWTAKVKWFIALATLGGFILIDVLIRICPWPSLTAVLIPAALFGLWLIEVLPPEVPGARPSRARLNDLTESGRSRRTEPHGGARASETRLVQTPGPSKLSLAAQQPLFSGLGPPRLVQRQAVRPPDCALRSVGAAGRPQLRLPLELRPQLDDVPGRFRHDDRAGHSEDLGTGRKKSGHDAPRRVQRLRTLHDGEACRLVSRLPGCHVAADLEQRADSAGCLLRDR